MPIRNPDDDILVRLQDNVICRAFEDRTIESGELALRLSGERKDAAAEIERLRALLARYRDETPPGHQPHMIAAEADRALGRAN